MNNNEMTKEWKDYEKELDRIGRSLAIRQLLVDLSCLVVSGLVIGLMVWAVLCQLGIVGLPPWEK